ncbi:hypothetical protein K458DRAFT_447777 [Lentithecium fluviatile CBS 122367]|uniref:Uncharacterized protein n=1 Tax=Lentithecium fluviatile CBS 122367 TaxID=1168545 RepID=A0A6G1ICG7_9PLEO|nr:hypothetical protein K458DRAFT_447777 [Lentithecium fluviatile CBS 122367]
MDHGWVEVERMAQAASAQDEQLADEHSPGAMARWQRLFGYTPVEAMHLIKQQHEDVTRDRITDEHWVLVKEEQETAGYDREAYEHSLRLPDVFKDNSATIPTTSKDGQTMLLLRLGGLLDSAEKVKEVAGLERLPKVVEGQSEVGIKKFCVVGKETQKRLEEWLVQQAILQK